MSGKRMEQGRKPIARVVPENCPKIARKLPENCPKIARGETIQWEGRRIPLVRDAGGIWRLRSRSKHYRIDVCLGTPFLAQARLKAKEALEEGKGTTTRPASRGSLQHLCDAYLSTPKRTAAHVAKDNVSRLRGIVRMTLDKDLAEVPVAKLTAGMWRDYQRARLAALGHPLDYSRRHAENHSINAAVRAARCVVMKTLRPAYEAQGIRLAHDADVVMWLPEPILAKPAADDGALVTAWATLRESDPALWLVIGLARFAGMRREEIARARGKWIVAGDVTSVELRDRPEDSYQTKTGKPYLAPIIHPDLAAVCAALPADELIVQPETTDRDRWFERAPQEWCRPFVGAAQKPLHRLRALYATDLQARTRDAVAAALAGKKAASAALGHTSIDVTERHYLD